MTILPKTVDDKDGSSNEVDFDKKVNSLIQLTSSLSSNNKDNSNNKKDNKEVNHKNKKYRRKTDILAKMSSRTIRGVQNYDTITVVLKPRMCVHVINVNIIVEYYYLSPPFLRRMYMIFTMFLLIFPPLFFVSFFVISFKEIFFWF